MRAPKSSVRKARCLYTHIIEGVAGSEGREGANTAGCWIEVGGRVGDGNGVGVGIENGNVNGDRGGDGAGTRTGVGANERTQYRNGYRSRDGNGCGDCWKCTVYLIVK